ncbi:MAG: protein translocase SEC61 complex subunit gamma [Nanoarchaeota archaeon]
MDEKPSLGIRAKSFLVQCRRVWHVLRKPTKTEYQQVAKISAIGVLILGVIGFLISLVIKVVIK